MPCQLGAPFRQSWAVEWQRPETNCCSATIEDYVQTGERGDDGRSACGDENPAVGNAYGDGGQTEGTEHRKEVRRDGIVRTRRGHRHEVS